MGLELGVSIALGAFFGQWLDKKWGTEPWMLLLFFMLGIFAGFLNLYRATQRVRMNFQNQPYDDYRDPNEPE